jgi:glycosyltransferase-like protein LARGE
MVKITRGRFGFAVVVMVGRILILAVLVGHILMHFNLIPSESPGESPLLRTLMDFKSGPPGQSGRSDLLMMEFQKVKKNWQAMNNEANHIIPNALPRKGSVTANDITVALHLSVSKLNRLLFSLKRWGGPISAAIVLRTLEDITTFEAFYSENSGALLNTSFHIMIEKSTNMTRLMQKYPNNILREMALQNVESDYFLALDLDFVTTPNCHRELRKLIDSDKWIVELLANKTLLVLPAFKHMQELSDEELMEIGTEQLPNSKEEAIKMVKRKTLATFNVKRFFEGHGPTNYSKWYADLSEQFYFVDYAKRFEPYVLGLRRSAPHYWAGFRGYGYNKWTWLWEAHKMGFKFAVLRDFFVIHLDHPYGGYRTNENYEEYKLFKRYLKDKYDQPNKSIDTP